MKIKAIVFEWMIDNKISVNDICYFVFQGSYNIEKISKTNTKVKYLNNLNNNSYSFSGVVSENLKFDNYEILVLESLINIVLYKPNVLIENNDYLSGNILLDVFPRYHRTVTSQDGKPKPIPSYKCKIYNVWEVANEDISNIPYNLSKISSTDEAESKIPIFLIEMDVICLYSDRK